MSEIFGGELKPVKRSKLRLAAGRLYYSLLYFVKRAKHRPFAKQRDACRLPIVCFRHKTILLRQLKDVDMQYQYNKIINLKIAAEKLNGIVIHPGETFSYWKLIGKPSYKKGYVDGMILNGGKVATGVGGGLCQLSNLIYWMALHTPLTIVQRHRHGYDVFPDSNRTQPFGSGATCFYPYGDLMIYNGTDRNYQLCVSVGEEYLEGEWLSDQPQEYRYEVFEKNHTIKSEYWGGYSRHNELHRKKFDLNNNFIDEEFITDNHALMMYSPFLPAGNK
ncbi:MAG: Vancomycin B-type resistance protein VanW [Firmicutes bacterium ADurb.Bin193]|nr:MAG: Vancomycin B-type resistance protein VanW [Firmicutes bacterium ADurb.Bin193]